MKFSTDHPSILYLTTSSENASPTSSSADQDHTTNESLIPFDNEWLPLWVLESTVLFPDMFTHFALKDQQTIKYLQKVYAKNQKIGLIASKKNNRKGLESLYKVGTLAQIHKIIHLPESQVMIILQGEKRFTITELVKKQTQFIARVNLLQDLDLDTTKPKNKALIQSLQETAIKTLSIVPDVPNDIFGMIKNIKRPLFLTYYIASVLLEFPKKQKLLETSSSQKRATLLLSYLLKNLEFAQLKQKIHHQVHTDMDKLQRELYIKQQIKVLQRELGDSHELEGDEIKELTAQSQKQKWSLTVQTHFDKTLQKASRTHPHSPDYNTLINYAHILIEMPWQTYTPDKKSLPTAEKILNKNHYGMEKPKQRILEFLAVHTRTQQIQGPILCLHGPPGVGKTSLCQSIAKALGRKYIKMSLGGLHDEAELRGHRKTYVGAMLGKPLNLIKNACTANPVFVLDEIDKLDSRRGDPGSALLEILDPNQNQAFVDNYLEIPFDLSKVLFIATANDKSSIPWALADRMEFIEVSGYALEEKIQIANKYLIPKQRKIHALKASQLTITQPALAKLIETHTSESGVRELTRQIATLSRKITKKLVAKEPHPTKITPDDITTLLGIEKYDVEQYQKINTPGVAIGLAWTAVGGEILFIEAVLTKGDGTLTISGQLGEVMEESAKAAHTYLKAHAQALHIDTRIFQHYDLHIHVPDGSTPKDGPSAGITLYTTLASLYTQRKVKEKLAMTGEITLRGSILPVGGIKEKILAAKRAGIEQIILSEKNKKDVQEINPNYIKNITFNYLNHVDELLPLTLAKNKIDQAQVWTIDDQEKKYPTKKRFTKK